MNSTIEPLFPVGFPSVVKPVTDSKYIPSLPIRQTTIRVKENNVQVTGNDERLVLQKLWYVLFEEGGVVVLEEGGVVL